ncbi:group I truncated hemoglobin [Amycolatopsis nigrescens]|uniref:group I truncated hemoglobin n=1 Tax=Amycolatopsis nigrescens TaxID=381445 RepID=UPI000360BD5C|nr:group 1 truncated hemoglobin [Amycolatopsis nigrescens]
MPDSDLYRRLGKEAGISTVVEDFYRRVLDDNELRSFFAEVSLPSLRRHMTAFLAAATGGPVSYQGRDMPAAHRGLGITDTHFDAVAGKLVETLRAHQVPAPDIDAVVGKVGGLRGEIVEVAG